jgi:hypothetical protein
MVATTDAFTYAEELQLQSICDLETARLLAQSKGHPEHIAWLCGQSYEKILKYGYATYLANTGESAEQIKNHFRRMDSDKPWSASLEVVQQTSDTFSQLLLDNKGRYPMAKVLAGALEPQWSKFQQSVNQVLDTTVKIMTTNAIIENTEASIIVKNYTRGNFSAASAMFDSQTIFPSPVLMQSIESLKQNFSKLGFAELTELMFLINKGYLLFIGRAIMLAPWVLPLAEWSSPSHNLTNLHSLRAIRENEVQLVDYFDAVCPHLEKLIEAAGHFNEAIERIYKFTQSTRG